MLPLDAESGRVEARAPSAIVASERLNDMVIAHAIVHDIRGIPGVLDMGQGLFARAATYGPGKHVAGIVLGHPAPGEFSVEVHIVLDETTFIKAPADGSSRSDTTPVLLVFTDKLRAVVYQTFEHLGLSAPTLVDVTIDDIR
jgi:hypothetical protein